MAKTNRTVQFLRYRNASFNQSENAVLDYVADYGAELQGDIISASEWVDDLGGLTIATESNTDTTATAFISATSPGHYKATNKVTTGNRTLELTFSFTITDNSTGITAPDPQAGDYCR